MENTLLIRMLGSMELEKNGIIISDKDNRSRKMWLLLAYLIFFRTKKISQQELFSVLWKDDEKTGNPAGVFKVLLHRTRSLLNELEPDFGKKCILCEKGEYFFNPNIYIQLDIDYFESKSGAIKSCSNLQERTTYLTELLSVYHGDFLERFDSESWILSASAYFRNIYLQGIHELLDIYENEQNHLCAITLCQQVCSLEKYEEHFYIHLMKSLLYTEQYQEAVHVYQKLRTTLTTEFNVRPCNELQSLYAKARQGLHSDLIDIADVPKLMKEHTPQKGALYCEFDTFKHIYHFSARGLERNGTVIHLILLNLTDISERPLPKRSLEVGVRNLRTLLCNQLRCGDIVSMCSPSQFLLLLPNANFENSQKVTQRLMHQFYKKYPHTPVKLTSYIQPIIPITLE